VSVLCAWGQLSSVHENTSNANTSRSYGNPSTSFFGNHRVVVVVVIGDDRLVMRLFFNFAGRFASYEKLTIITEDIVRTYFRFFVATVSRYKHISETE